MQPPLPPSLVDGKTFVVTGANIGLGFACAQSLVRDGATVIMACRNEGRARAAMDAIGTHARGSTRFYPLDLASLSSIERFADTLHANFDTIDGLCNNAGIMAVPRHETEDGFERQFGTNHLGHFALSLRLLPLLRASEGARVVTVTSLAHRAGIIDLEDLQGERRYRRWGAYAQSKLANLMFALEFDRRCARESLGVSSLAAHPGYSATGLVSPRASEGGPTWLSYLGVIGNSLVAQSATLGAQPILHAFRSHTARGGDFFGPDGWGEFAGQPSASIPSRRARDPGLAARLWERSEQLTGLSFPGCA